MYRFCVVLLTLLLINACGDSAIRRPAGGPGEVGILGSHGSAQSSGRPMQSADHIGPRSKETNGEAYIEIGSGTYVAVPPRDQIQLTDDGSTVSLNFLDVELQEFVRAVFDEVLKKTVIVDPALKGRITLRTSSPISKSAAIDLVREALQVHGASLIISGDSYRIAARSDQRTGRRIGEAIRIIPLRYIGAEEAKTTLAPFLSPGVEIIANATRHYLTIAGPPSDLDNLESVIANLDIDQLKGMSVALIPLREASATLVAEELIQVLNVSAAQSVRALPITRMNAVLIISSRPHVLTQARQWIARLDRSDGDGRRIYVYPVQNRRASDIATVLVGILEQGNNAQPGLANRAVAPDLTPVSSTGAAKGIATDLAALGSPPPSTSTRSATRAPGREALVGATVTADTSTNSVVVSAKPDEWKVIESALRRLDLAAPQVLIEATIAEVRLNDSLRHGVRWFLESGNHSIVLTNSETGSLASVFPGFNYVFGVPRARIVLNALERVTDVEVVSSPALTVLDNQTAKLQVGDQVPVATRAARSVVNPDAPIVNDIEFKDTGVILSVTPRVNSSGLVNLDIAQEVSDVVPTTTSNLESPTIRQRRINSSVAVQSGTEIVLGGLIGTSRNKRHDGIPALMSIPILGELFKSDGLREGLRTELLIILRPTVIGNQQDVRVIANEIKRRLSGAKEAIYRR